MDRDEAAVWAAVSRSHPSAAGRFKDRVEPGGAWVYGNAAKEVSHWYRSRLVELRAVRRPG